MKSHTSVKKCQECGTLFKPLEGYYSRTRFCVSCRHTRFLRQVRARYQSKIAATRDCSECGRLFKPKQNPYTKFCYRATCIRKRRLKSYYKHKVQPPLIRSCRACASSFKPTKGHRTRSIFCLSCRRERLLKQARDSYHRHKIKNRKSRLASQKRSRQGPKYLERCRQWRQTSRGREAAKRNRLNAWRKYTEIVYGYLPENVIELLSLRREFRASFRRDHHK